MKQVSRRSFLVGAAGAAGVLGLGLSGCAPRESGGSNKATAASGEWDEETDVVVVGFGGGGGAAAIEAYDNGASVLVLDASDTPGGATSINGGVIQCAGSSVQQAAGITDDSAERWFECLKLAMEDGFDEGHVKRLTEEGPDNLDWLMGLGAEIPAEIHPTDTHDIPESGLYYSDASCELFPDDSLVPRGHVVVGGGGGFLKAFTSGGGRAWYRGALWLSRYGACSG